jgi:hypothetical protein
MTLQSAISLQSRPLDIQMAEIARRFKAAGVALPARLCCENDQAFVARVTQRYPDIVFWQPGGHRDPRTEHA